MIKARFLLLLTVVTFASRASGQQIAFSNPFERIGVYADYLPLRTAGDQLFILATGVGGAPEILVYNTRLEPVKRNAATAFRTSNPLSIRPEGDHTMVLAEFPGPGMNIYRSVQIDSNGSPFLVKDLAILNTKPGMPWSYVKSEQEQYHLFYQVNNPANDSLAIEFMVLGTDWEELNGTLGNPPQCGAAR